MRMTNLEIFNTAQDLARNLQGFTQYLPIKVNFYIQKNKKTLFALAQDIDNARLHIIKTYGRLDSETNEYVFDADVAETVQRELNDLFNLEQEVEIYMVNINSFPEDLVISPALMEALMFMID